MDGAVSSTSEAWHVRRRELGRVHLVTGIVMALLDGGATYLSPLSSGTSDGGLTHGAPTYECIHREDYHVEDH